MKIVPPILAALALAAFALDQHPATFRYEDPQATSVAVAGEFNQWHAAAMERDADGVWTLTIDLPAGTHAYKFLVNGETWTLDPANLDRTMVDGAENSVITVDDTATAPAATADTPAPLAPDEWTFTYSDPSAQTVFVAGSFNGWNTESHPLTRNDEGVWTATIPLPPGETTYKFIVNGEWKTDPANPAVAEDGQGGSNSVINPAAAP